ncbi:MAG: HyaD/HybD family hydrogenase maturation endopeptidase [Xanthobacteraceae bacterium]
MRDFDSWCIKGCSLEPNAWTPEINRLTSRPDLASESAIDATSFPAPRQILVLGIGNTLLGDEGIGVHAMRAIAKCCANIPKVRCVDGGTLSFSLAPEIEQCSGLIVQDAAELQAPAGEVRVFIGDAMDEFLGSNRKRSVHEVGLLDLMAIAALTGHLPVRRALIGIQPEFVGWRDGPSERVARSIPEACTRALDLIKSWPL